MIIADQYRAPKWYPPGGPAVLQGNTPNLTARAAKSYVFPNYFPAATNCTPSRATLLTGLYSQQQCMFLGDSKEGNPTLLGGANGFDTFATALLNAATPGGWTSGQFNFSQLQNYDCSWVGKWHLSALDTGSSQACDLSGYGFGGGSANLPSIVQGFTGGNPTEAPSPIGWPNEGLNGGTAESNSNYAMGAPQVYASDSQIETWFTRSWMPYQQAQPSTQPWLCVVSLVNPHDIGFFPGWFNLSNAPNNCAVPPNYSSTCPFQANTAGQPFKYAESTSSPTNFYTALPTDVNGGPWNGTDLITRYGTSGSGPAGKPDLQTVFQGDIQALAGSVISQTTHNALWQQGWETFLNYYAWLQNQVDGQIGSVLGAVSGATHSNGTPLATNTITIFLSDHGEYGGSHTLQDKGGAAYDESINVPLYVSYPTQTSSTTIPYMVSSVDVMAYLLTIGSSSNAWRQSTSNRYTYLSGRESIEDFIFGTPVFRRSISVPDSQGNPISVQYIFHTYDETTAGESSTGQAYVSQVNGTYCHMICMRTAVIQDTHGKNVGGKIVRYDQWACNKTVPVGGSGYHGQYEFYDYSAAVNNVNELGNNVTLTNSEPSPNTNASAYLTQLNTILNVPNSSFASELCYIPPIYTTAHTNARCAYFVAVASITGCGPAQGC
jgi:arylsulfatase A-like enzyme